MELNEEHVESQLETLRQAKMDAPALIAHLLLKRKRIDEDLALLGHTDASMTVPELPKKRKGRPPGSKNRNALCGNEHPQQLGQKCTLAHLHEGEHENENRKWPRLVLTEATA